MRLGVPVLASLMIGSAAGLSAAPGGAQELQFLCHTNQDGTVSAEQAQRSAEQCAERAAAGVDDLAVEQISALPDADRLREQFAQVDEDGDGRISREEWLRSFGPAHARATEGAGSRPVGSD